ncbi:MAG TPA: cell wall hydrolase [Allosphingosinicella sp.]|nr:cell wall hydrolase [Allosphingosinicella sp.]
MALGVTTRARRPRGIGRVAPAWAWLTLIVPMASCVPAAATQAPAFQLEAAAAPAPPPTGPAGAAPLAAVGALAANAALPIDGGLNPAATPFAFRAATPIDQLRSLDCLAQAVFYEARSESEDGQRAVAQVVLNRVRHPAWPNSVCGVVYQGPMRPGGGCQFTFTCDGSLAVRPVGLGWARARMIAADALAGRTFAGVGLSTHYHTHAVFPSWAPRLLKTAMIGAHNFYRLPGTPGLAGAFNAHYSGSEPVPRSAGYFPFRAAAAQLDLAAFAQTMAADVRAPAAVPSDIPQDARWTPSNLPESTIRDEYRQAGQWRDDAPASVTGAR